ncbi:hypothetical protein [Acidovorax sp.]|uniref:hypothetical protein n=1 Tax=Acidovorax sp. TaxID=1872122 RepID=UPI00391D5B23
MHGRDSCVLAVPNVPVMFVFLLLRMAAVRRGGLGVEMAAVRAAGLWQRRGHYPGRHGGTHQSAQDQHHHQKH